MLAGDRVSHGLGIRLIDAGPGPASLGMAVREDMLKGFGTCHGGILFTLADTALSCACNSHNRRSVAHHCSIVFLRPGRLGQQLVATATERALNGRTGIYVVDIRDDLGQTVGEFFGHSRIIEGQVVGTG
jgi:acyl-CoA thioesterase